jgi:hypothetical protein
MVIALFISLLADAVRSTTTGVCWLGCLGGDVSRECLRLFFFFFFLSDLSSSDEEEEEEEERGGLFFPDLGVLDFFWGVFRGDSFCLYPAWKMKHASYLVCASHNLISSVCNILFFNILAMQVWIY